MKPQYSESFERDYAFYLKNIEEFTFCGTLLPKHQAIPNDNGLSAKEVFYLIDSQGKNKECCEPELLDKLLLCKAGVNFQIKQWAEGRHDATLPKSELTEYLEKINAPEWVGVAVEKQRLKLYLAFGMDELKSKITEPIVMEYRVLMNTTKTLSELARTKGYQTDKWVVSKAFPNTKLRIGYGMIWSETQKALVVGCTDIEHKYYTAVPIHEPETGWWAEIV